MLYPERRLELEPKALQALEGVEAIALGTLDGPNGLCQIVSEFTFHWELRDEIDAAKQRNESNPDEFTVYIEEDYLDSN